MRAHRDVLAACLPRTRCSLWRPQCLACPREDAATIGQRNYWLVLARRCSSMSRNRYTSFAAADFGCSPKRSSMRCRTFRSQASHCSRVSQRSPNCGRHGSSGLFDLGRPEEILRRPDR